MGIASCAEFRYLTPLPPDLDGFAAANIAINQSAFYERSFVRIWPEARVATLVLARPQLR
jgi:hypothetical protein